MLILSYLFALVDTVEHILKLADEYQIQVVVEQCRRYLHTQTLNTNNALRVLTLCQRYKFEQLRQNCYPMLKKLELKRLRSQPLYGEMDEESYRKVVTARREENEEILPDLKSLVWGLLRLTEERKLRSCECCLEYGEQAHLEVNRQNLVHSDGNIGCLGCGTESMYDSVIARTPAEIATNRCRRYYSKTFKAQLNKDLF